MGKIIEKIHQKLEADSLLSRMARKLSLSELNSFLLELFRRKAAEESPARLLRQFCANRFVRPAEVDTLCIRQTELDWLRYASERQFQPITLSPLAPLGTCSAIGHVDQNNVLSALRGTEVVSDATNVLALKIAEDTSKSKDKNAVFRYAAAHRHVRGQAFDNPSFTAHFSVFCLASGGRDRGNYSFELNQLNEHLTICHNLLSEQFGAENLLIRFYLKNGSEAFREKMMDYKAGLWHSRPHEFREDYGHEYYDLIQFKIFLNTNGRQPDLADGGPVGWAQRLLSNRKYRLFISGIGLELVHKISTKSL